eukprot:3270462-Pyramimonas_sp.AAC.1
MGGSVSEAKKAAVTSGHCAAAPGLEGPPAEQAERRLGPEEKYICAHWGKPAGCPGRTRWSSTEW